MIVTRENIQTFIGALTIQDALPKDDFLHILTLTRIAMATDTIPELLAACDTTNAEEQILPQTSAETPLQPTGADAFSTDRRNTVQAAVDQILAEMRAAGIPIPAPEPDAETIEMKFFGPESDPLPTGGFLVMPHSFRRLPKETQDAILKRVELATNLLGTCVKRYQETGTFPAGTVRNGQSFREYAADVIKRAAAIRPGEATA